MHSDKSSVIRQTYQHMFMRLPSNEHGGRHPNTHNISPEGSSAFQMRLPTCPSVFHMHFLGTILWPHQHAFLKTHVLLKLRAVAFCCRVSLEGNLMRLAGFTLLTPNRIWLRPSATMKTRVVLALAGAGHFAVLDGTEGRFVPFLPYCPLFSN